jgi:hypothetical protein
MITNSRRPFHLSRALPTRRQNETLMAPHARLDPEAELFEFLADLDCAAAFARLDENRNGRGGAQ